MGGVGIFLFTSWLRTNRVSELRCWRFCKATMHSRAEAEVYLISPDITIFSLIVWIQTLWNSVTSVTDVKLLLPQMRIFVDKIIFISSLCFSNKGGISCYCLESRYVSLCNEFSHTSCRCYRGICMHILLNLWISVCYLPNSKVFMECLMGIVSQAVSCLVFSSIKTLGK